MPISDMAKFTGVVVVTLASGRKPERKPEE